jgi:chemotaxis protein MotB
MAHIIGTALLGLTLSGALTGCVTQEKYNALKLDRDGLAEQLAKSQTDESSARAEADSYKNQLAMLNANGSNLTGLVSNLQQQVATLTAQNSELNQKYAEAMNRPVGANALPEPLSNALTEFARQNPDLVDFDAARGIVKFKSDITFSVGSSELTAPAKAAITRFSEILNSQAANGYELLVAGHTDNQKVSNPATIKAGNLDNWYLSSHRAISVAAEMRHDSVNPQRLGVVGYADQRPVASNNTSAGQAQNRRVEVLILPTTVKSQSVASTPDAAGAKLVSKRIAANKDTQVKVESGPVLNK